MDALQHAGLDEARLTPALRLLKWFKLLQPSLDDTREWDPLAPDAALAELLADDEVELKRRQARVELIRSEIFGLLPAYAEARRAREASEGVDTVGDELLIRKLLGEWVRRSTQEISVVHPGKVGDHRRLADVLKRDPSALRAGVQIKIVLPDSTAPHAPPQEYAAAALSSVEIRTAPVVPRHLILFDREVAFVPFERKASAGAVLVREPAIVDNLVASFELLWTTALPYPQWADQEDARDVLQQTILKHLALGEKDEVIARRLGLSVRTCRRHIASIMEKLNASSRFQAGLLAARREMIDVGNGEEDGAECMPAHGRRPCAVAQPRGAPCDMRP
ncbi:LuxR C-terminal-related transcriptional regulator [Plantactinospora sp. CA-290183]|uniref:helix-turn-helix transcriptional regulator n=1 Tax=Plantactinospora sp. CA-290183 TaxID=3240006 RepID=UPI003D925ACD